MRRSDFFYTAILLPLDYLAILAAGSLAYHLRKTELIRNLDIVSQIFYQIPFKQYLYFLLIISAIWLVFFSIIGLYGEKENRQFTNQIIKVFLASSTGVAAIIVFLFFKREFLFSSRFVVLTGWVLSFFLVCFFRALVRVIRRILLHFNFGAKPVVVIGGDQNTKNFINQLNLHPEWGCQIVARVLTLKQLKNKIKKLPIKEVILADLQYSKQKVNQLLEFCQVHHLDFRYAADIFSAHLHNIEMSTLAGFPFIEIKRTPLEGWGKMKKRAMDFIFGLIFILIFFIPGIIIAFLIKLDSKGPILVKLKRVGENGQEFKIYKFRSMIVKAHQLKKNILKYNQRTGPLFKMKNDPRITKVGKILRRFSLDELPNFYNVLKGDMSLVGPRPHEPAEVEKYQNYQKKLLNIKPGVTGLAQISGRSNLSFKEEARLDLYYIENWNLKLDITILFKTPIVALFQRNGAV